MTEELQLENWSDIKSLRESKGISLFELSEKMRLPQERIEFLEIGHFDKNDLIITKLQIKNYAKIVGLEYELLINLAGLETPKENLIATPLGDNVKIKKTRRYKGRKKEVKKGLIYTLIVIVALVLIFAFNRLAIKLNVSSDVFEMTQQQVNALDTPNESAKDTNSFKPFLPQVQKEEVSIDIIETMDEFYTKNISFPLIIKIFPKDNLSYRHEIKGLKPIENYILKDTPTLVKLTKPGRIIFYNTHSSRFVLDKYEIRDESISQILIDINEDRELICYIK